MGKPCGLFWIIPPPAGVRGWTFSAFTFSSPVQKGIEFATACKLFSFRILSATIKNYTNVPTMKIKFCGAAREVTGSAHLLTLDDGFTILLDCGLYQGGDEDMADFNRKWLFNPAYIDCMILSHAHIDHTGRIPKLVKDGFRKNIHCTHATRSLATIMLLDSAKIQEGDAAYQTKIARKSDPQARETEPLYDTDDAYNCFEYFVGHSYDSWFNVHPDVEVLFTDAGHILGSACVTLRIKENGKTYVLGFTADIGRPARPILRDPQPMPEADFLLCESTYGDRLHESAPAELDHFLKVIHHTCLEKKGKLIIPAFSVGRTQELVYMLDQLENAGKLPDIPVYVDSPLAVNATGVFGNHPECFDKELHEYMLVDPNPFGFNGLTYIHSVEASKQLNKSHQPCIIISASGMMNAGRIQHHLFNGIENRRNTILIVGYCSPETLGGRLRAGNKSVHIFGQFKQVLAEIEIMDSFSAHGDRDEMYHFISNQKGSVKQLFLVHGVYDSQVNFQFFLKDRGFNNIEIPRLGEEFQLT